jgi:hypothetical protein
MPLCKRMHMCQQFWPYLGRYMPLYKRMHVLAVLAILAQTHASL